MRPNWVVYRAMGPLGYFGTFFAFVLPPLGFFMGYKGYRRDKEAGERYVGWIVIMAISVLTSIIYTIGLIMIISYGGESDSSSSEYYYQSAIFCPHAL